MDQPDESSVSDTDPEELRDRLDDLERRLDEAAQTDREGDGTGAAIAYLSGYALAVTLSWSRNGSILWCILHGVFSWIYVLWFAFTR